MKNRPQISFWSEVLNDFRFGLKFKFSKKQEETSCETEIFCEPGKSKILEKKDDYVEAMTIGDISDELS